MRGRSALGGADPSQPAGVQAHQLRGQQFLGQQDRARRQVGPAVLLAGQHQQHPPFQIQQVVDPLGDAPVAETAQGLDIGSDGAAPGEARALALADQPRGVAGQLRVVEKGGMRAQNGAPRLVLAALGLAGDAAGDGGDGGVQGRALLRRPLAGLDHRQFLDEQPHGLAHRQAWRGHDALELGQARPLGRRAFGER